MLHILQNSVAIANRGNAMEPETISKNGVSPKNQRSRKNFNLFTYTLFIIACLVIFAVSCKKDKDDSNNNGGTTAPSAPTGVDAYKSGSNVYVYWKSVENATSYKVFRSSSASGDYFRIGSSTSDTEFIDDSPLSGNNYYRVKAVNDAGESDYSDYVYCDFSGGGGGTTPPNAPTGIEAYQNDAGVYISWNSVSDATRYKVYRSSSADGSYSQIGNPTSSTGFTDSNPLNGSNYYKVKAVNDAGESDYSAYAYCDFSGGGGEVVPNPPTGLSSIQSGSSIIISWNSSAGAVSYKVYTSSSASGTYTEIGWVTGTSYTDYPLASRYYYYKVSAINSVGESAQSDYTSCDFWIGRPPAPTDVSATLNGSTIYVSWSSSAAATSYNVYRSVTYLGPYTKIGSTGDTNYTDYSPLGGPNHYQITAVNGEGESAPSEYAYCNFPSANTQVRFKKMKDYIYCTALAVLNSSDDILAGYTFWEYAGTSEYYEIPPGKHYPAYYFLKYPDVGWYYCFNSPYTYEFKAGRKYTLVCDDSGADFKFYITDDGPCKSSGFIPLGEIVTPIISIQRHQIKELPYKPSADVR